MALIDFTKKLPDQTYEVAGTEREILYSNCRYLEIRTAGKDRYSLVTQYKARSFLGLVRWWSFNGWSEESNLADRSGQ